jgi:Ni,Fe-hydrogenase III component G
MLENLFEVEKENIYAAAEDAKKEGYRFAALTCEGVGDSYELFYHFDRDYVLKNIKVEVFDKAVIRSISKLYPSAFLIENEIQDFYGFTFEELIIDYKGNLYLAGDAPKTPMIKIREGKE